MAMFDNFFGSQEQPQKPARGLFGNLDPETIGLLGAASAGLQASGPSLMPISFTQVVGKMLGGGVGAYDHALDSQLKRDEMKQMSEYRKAQMDALKLKSAQSQKLQDFITSRLTGMPGAMPSADMEASADALGQGSQAGDIGPTLTNATRMNSIRPPQVQGQNSSFPFSLNDVTALHAMGGPDLTASYKLATEPFQMSANSLYKDRVTGAERYIPKLPDGMSLGPNNTASVVPGFIAGNNAIKGGEAAVQEGAKAANDLVTVNLPGGPRQMTRAQAVALATGSQPSSLPSPSIPQPSSSSAEFPRVSHQQQAAADQEALRYAKQDIDNAQTPEAKAQAQQVYETMVARSNAGQSVITGGQLGQPGLPGIPLQSEADKRKQVGAVDVSQKVAENSLERFMKESDAQQNILNNLGIMKRLVNQGILGSDPISQATMFAHSKGLNNSDIAVRTARVRQLGEALITAKGLGAQISNTDAARYEAAAGRLNNPVSQKDAIEAIKIMEEIASNAYKSTADRINNFNATGGMTAPTPPSPAPNLLPQLPAANKSNVGKIAIDHDTGKRYKSNGMQWKEVQ